MKPHSQRLYDCLASSSELSASNIVIEDISPWYAARSLLGPRRHSARIVKRIDATTSRTNTAIPARFRLRSGDIYSAEIFDIHPHSRKILQTSVGYYATSLQAHSSCQEAQEARDERFVGVSSSPTHLKVRVVNKSFNTLDHSQRIEVVYKILLDEYSRPSLSEVADLSETTIESNVSKLPHMQSLQKKLPFELLLELRDHEIKPAPPGVLSELPNLPHVRRIIANKNPIFHGMNYQVRHLTMKEYEKSSALAVAQPLAGGGSRGMATKSSGRAVTRSTLTRQKDKNPVLRRRRQGKAVDTIASEVSAKLAISAHKLSNSTMQMQRMWRRNQLCRMDLSWSQWNRAALDIQRIFRGVQGRYGAIHWRKKSHASIVTLQRYIRGAYSRRFVATRRRQWTHFATLLQTAVRGWIARRCLRWMIANTGTATAIQRVARGYLGRCIYRETLRKKEDLLRHEAAIRIQARARAFIQKHRYTILLCEIHHQTVEVPRILQVQAFWRKCLATSLLHRLDKERNAATTIQSHLRGVSIRRIVQAHRHILYRHRCATKIQSIIRGFLDRCFVVRTRRIKHYYFVTIPSAIKIQSVFRGRRERLRQKSAMTIQTAHRRSKAHRYTQDKWLNYVRMLNHKSALVIQTWYRSRSSRRRYLLLLDHERGRRLCASRTIIRGWRTYKKRERFLLEKKLSDYKRSQDTIKALQREQKRIRTRIKSVDDEIEANRIASIEAEKRLKELKGELEEATSLMGVVESEEVFFSVDADAERSRLQLQLRDVTDSIADSKDIIKSSTINIDRLQMEQDQLYANDLDRLCCLEHEEHENQRRAELQRCMARKELEWRERIRFERTKWAVKLPKAKERASETSDIAYHRTISTSKRRELVSRKQQAEAQKKTSEAILKRHQNDKAVRQLYDRIFHNMNSIMKS